MDKIFVFLLYRNAKSFITYPTLQVIDSPKEMVMMYTVSMMTSLHFQDHGWLFVGVLSNIVHGSLLAEKQVEGQHVDLYLFCQNPQPHRPTFPNPYNHSPCNKK